MKQRPYTRRRSPKKAYEGYSKRELEKVLDSVFSVFIRLRVANGDGYVKCFTCGAIMLWTKAQCGHYWSRINRSLRWDEENCQVQCMRCNIYMHGNYPKFGIELVRKYGVGILERLDIKSSNVSRMKNFELEVLILNYAALIESMDKGDVLPRMYKNWRNHGTKKSRKQKKIGEEN